MIKPISFLSRFLSRCVTGATAGPTYVFCGLSKQSSQPYCPDHLAITHIKPDPRLVKSTMALSSL
jgi:hypothetical protein